MKRFIIPMLLVFFVLVTTGFIIRENQINRASGVTEEDNLSDFSLKDLDKFYSPDYAKSL
ncbi:MAG: hypothetical protein MJB14_03870 [Spirochaetes bacterium]|nr:hypothetical protein [Spirochaetota bacterium]